MLTHLSISNYAIAESLEVELHTGMTVLTGETGAGKSIMLDALGLALGDRADASIVRHGADKAEIHALFDLSGLTAAQAWLQERDLLAGSECMLRRVITSEGRSRAYINGQPSTLQDIRALSNQLIDIHSQHEHQYLLKRDHQRRLLDAFAGAEALSQNVAEASAQWQQHQRELREITEQRNEHSARSQLLSYQLEELDRLAVKDDELETLQQEQKQLANAEQIIASGHHALALCKEGEINALSILSQALASLRASGHQSERQAGAEQLLESALIQVEEASHELQHHLDHVELDPERLREVETRLDAIFQVARKHHVRPTELAELHQRLADEFNQINASDERVEQLQAVVESCRQRYDKLAAELSAKRQKGARQLCKQVEKQLSALAMANCRFDIAFAGREGNRPHPHGREEIEFLISTNPGSPAAPLNRIASGGELSRISLAIQVVTARVATVPTIIFDEVDVGIGGAIAEIVGQLLHTLGRSVQVLCVTHQAQVASKGDHHIKVEKNADKKRVRTALQKLDDQEKVEEIARMLGGIAITENTRAHAREMVDVRH